MASERFQSIFGASRHEAAACRFERGNAYPVKLDQENEGYARNCPQAFDGGFFLGIIDVSSGFPRWGKVCFVV